MFNVMITGAGKIGSLIACLLARTNDYTVHLVDVRFSGGDVGRLLKQLPAIKTVTMDVTDEQQISHYILENNIEAAISSLPYFLNVHLAKAAKTANVHYFDLTEDTSVTNCIKKIAHDAKSAFVPQCGLAPGFISIAANSLMQEFDVCKQAKLRVGALPQHASNALQYSLTWSTDGLINEYGNTCTAIEKGRRVLVKPLQGLEAIQIDGCEYEAFNTSGGLGSLSEIYDGKIETLNYKTMRYPGHCVKMRFLMNDLRLNDNRDILKIILEEALPKTYQDIVIIYVAVEGLKNGELTEKSYVKRVYPAVIESIEWSAIQVSTASGICSVVDTVLQKNEEYHGLVFQEKFALSTILANRFSHCFQ